MLRRLTFIALLLVLLAALPLHADDPILLAGHSDVILALAFSPDGRQLASSSADATVRLWDLATKKTVHILRGHQDDVYAAAFSVDGRRLASGSGDSTVRLWDAASGSLVRELTEHEDKVHAIAFSPDGRYLVSGSWDRTIRLWDATTGEPVKILARQETGVVSLSFSPDGRRLLTGTGSGGSNICYVFAVPSGEELSRFKHDDIVVATAFAANGNLVATGGEPRPPVSASKRLLIAPILPCKFSAAERQSTISFLPAFKKIITSPSRFPRTDATSSVVEVGASSPSTTRPPARRSMTLSVTPAPSGR